MDKTLKRAISWLLVLLTIFISNGCTRSAPSKPDTWHLFVLGEEISQPQIQEISGVMCVSITEILSLYGYDIAWENETVASVRKDVREYIWSLTDKTLCEAGSNMDMLCGGEGNFNYRCDIVGQDMHADVVTISVLLQLLGELRYNTNCNYELGIICFGCNFECACHQFR